MTAAGRRGGIRLRRAAFGLALALALALVSAAPPHAAAADASLVVAALHIAEREYFQALDSVAMLNAAIASLRSRAALDGTALPDIPAGTAEEEAVRLFTAEFTRAETAASASEPEFAYAVRVRRRGSILELPVTRAVIHTPAVEAQMIRPGVAYVRIWGFSRGAAVETRRALDVLGQTGGIRAIVLDLRANPGGLVIEAEGIAGLFVPAGTVLARTHAAAASGEFVASGEALFPDVPLALLTDHGSASGAEILTIGLRDANRAIVVGETTAGAFGGARDFPLPEGGILVTTRALTGPRGEAIEGLGIAPDRAVAITVADMLHGDDVQLDAALSLLGAAGARHRPVPLGNVAGRALTLVPAA